MKNLFSIVSNLQTHYHFKPYKCPLYLIKMEFGHFTFLLFDNWISIYAAEWYMIALFRFFKYIKENISFIFQCATNGMRSHNVHANLNVGHDKWIVFVYSWGNQAQTMTIDLAGMILSIIVRPHKCQRSLKI